MNDWNTLRTKIAKLIKAEREEEMAGAQPPEDAEVIRLEVTLQRERLAHHIEDMERRYKNISTQG